MADGELERRVLEIEARNRRVESDKAWETSWTRRLTIAVITYGAAAVLLLALNMEYPWLGALVPVLGYVLSTLSLPVIRNIWRARRSGE